jgi:hypothetical protein
MKLKTTNSARHAERKSRSLKSSHHATYTELPNIALKIASFGRLDAPQAARHLVQR